MQQLWDDVTAFKPAASRQQSAEIFLICQGYKAPTKLDPALTDPKRVFEAVEGETTGGDISAAASSVTVFHKNWDKPRRQRGGYDMEHLDATMRHIESVSDFVSAGVKDAIQILSSSTGLVFECDNCRDAEVKAQTDIKCNCKFFMHHPLTRPEIKECVSDLKLLSKSDFKGLLTWRTKMQDALTAQQEQLDYEKSTVDTANIAGSESDDDGIMSEDSEKEEAEIQAEIAELKERRQRERKRRKKKERTLVAKRRKQSALGMDLNAIDVPEHDKFFSLASITSGGDLNAVSEVNLDHVTDEQLFGGSDDDQDVVVGDVTEDNDSENEDEATRTHRLERDLDEAYNEYLQTTKNGLAKSGTKLAKRSKKAQRQKVVEEAHEDQEMALMGADQIAHDTKAYAKLLQGGGEDSDDDGDAATSEEEEGDSDGFDDEPMTPKEHASRSKNIFAKPKESNPLIHKFADEPTSVKTARWFSNPLFANIGKAAEDAAVKASTTIVADLLDNVKLQSTDANDMKPIAGEDVFASMPKTDKQRRHDRRLKQMERDERKKSRRAKKVGDTDTDFQLVEGTVNDSEEEVTADQKLEFLSDSKRKKVMEARDLIKAGMGTVVDQENQKIANSGVEIVSQEDTESSGKQPIPIMDDRKYDSEHEDYDSDDYVKTLALGTMLLRRSKEKAFVDASYNRFAWNDPAGLPDWFVDDENKHHRPQLPIPPALMAKLKEKMMALSTRPIAKVAEARARKSKRAKTKLAAAKKQAEAVANSSEMSEAMKLKAISKALQGQDSKRPSKKYIVAKKGRANTGVKGAKLVDKRLKSDTRSMKRAEKRKNSGKAGSSKKRRK